MEPLSLFYERYLDVLDITFQPIVDIHSGEVFGVEALLRETDTLGYVLTWRLYEPSHNLKQKAAKKIWTLFLTFKF